MAGRAFAIALFLPCPLLAQARGSAVEIRLDAMGGGRGTAAVIHAGGGVTVGISNYARAALLGGVGPSREGASARVEGLVRFHMDPMRERRWGVYGAAGAGVLWSSGTEPYLTLLFGAEGPRTGRWSPAIEIGLARGVRLAFLMRRGSQDRR